MGRIDSEEESRPRHLDAGAAECTGKRCLRRFTAGREATGKPPRLRAMRAHQRYSPSGVARDAVSREMQPSRQAPVSLQ